VFYHTNFYYIPGKNYVDDDLADLDGGFRGFQGCRAVCFGGSAT
jgi:hypothetical protein